jgi:Na+(H+)/acetate symporter ActP
MTLDRHAKFLASHGSDDACQAPADVKYYTVIGVRRVPDNAETALVFIEISVFYSTLAILAALQRCKCLKNREGKKLEAVGRSEMPELDPSLISKSITSN